MIFTVEKTKKKKKINKFTSSLIQTVFDRLGSHCCQMHYGNV